MLIYFKSFFPLIVGLSFWIYGNILLVEKLKIKTTEKNELEKSIGRSIYQNSEENKSKVINNKDSFHLNSLITKNISLFTQNPNYKMLAWLTVQLIIFSLFVLAINILKNNLMPYFNY